MNRLQTFQEFIASQSMKIPVFSFIINLIIVAFLAIILAKIYDKYGKSLSNRKIFGKNFLLLAMITMLIISIVKSSLALSLGLVGALSIVRFRAAIKEPEELMYLFFAIAIGLGFGANQGIITIVAFITTILIIIMREKFSHNKYEDQNLYLTISSNNPQKINIEDIVEILSKHCASVNLKRFDENENIFESTFLIEIDNVKTLNICKKELQKIYNSIDITFLDNKGLI